MMRSVLLAGVILSGLVANAVPAAESGFPAATSSLSQCENRWVLLNQRDPAQRVVGFVYVDPERGFTLNHYGLVAVGNSGELVLVPDEIRGKAHVIIRIEQDIPAYCLDEKTIATLQLPPRDDLIANYRDTRPAGQHLEAWATHYNHIGAVKQGLEFTGAALALGYTSGRLSFERGFAFNALERFDEAARLLEPAVKDLPADIDMIAELAYAYMGQGDTKRAIATYERAIDADKKGTSARRWEFAQNIAASYNRLGDRKQTAVWIERAEKWKAEQGKREEASRQDQSSGR